MIIFTIIANYFRLQEVCFGFGSNNHLSGYIDPWKSE